MVKIKLVSLDSTNETLLSTLTNATQVICKCFNQILDLRKLITNTRIQVSSVSVTLTIGLPPWEICQNEGICSFQYLVTFTICKVFFSLLNKATLL